MADEDIKAKYQELAHEDKARFKKEMENYVPSEVVEKEEKKEKFKKAKDAPKNARSAYIFYSQNARALIKEENPEMNGKEIMTEMGRRWKEIKDTNEAEKYHEMATADKERYESEMKVYYAREV